MKYTTTLFGIIVLLILWVVFPLSFIKLNSILFLPVYVFGMFRLIGILLIILGLCLSLLASITFIKFGDGTPAIIEPPQKLVAKGLYKRTRNPIYIAHILIVLGLFIFFGHLTLLVYVVLIATGFHLYLIKIEEPLLRKRHGENYLEYTRQVPRWF